MQLANAALVLRPRSPWEAMDLAWRSCRPARPRLRAWCLSFVPLALLFLAVGWALEAPWLAFALVWWLKPLYDRTLLHVLSRGIFGVVLGPRAVLADTKEWLGHGLIARCSGTGSSSRARTPCRYGSWKASPGARRASGSSSFAPHPQLRGLADGGLVHFEAV